MASWSDIGHGMRRRMGAPSNHVEAAGKSMSRNHESAEEAMQSATGARVPMGTSAYASDAGHEALEGLTGTLVPRKNVQAADPTAGGKANRQNIERIGATYRVNAAMGKSIDPAAGPTMANARIVPSVQGRANPNFESGMQASY